MRSGTAAITTGLGAFAGKVGGGTLELIRVCQRHGDVDVFKYLPRRDADYAVGGFDEGYFLHCEDLDLCRRVRDAGHVVLLAGDVSVLHAGGGSSRRRPLFVSWHKHRGMWRWFRRFDPAARHPLLVPVVWIGLWAHFALTAPRLAWSGWRARRRPRAALSDSG